MTIGTYSHTSILFSRLAEVGGLGTRLLVPREIKRILCRSAALVVAAVGGTSINYVATSTAMKPTRRTSERSNRHSDILRL